MKLKIIILSILSLISLSTVTPQKLLAVEAGNINKELCDKLTDDQKKEQPACTTPTTNPISGKDGILIKVARLISIIIGVAAVIMLMIGGLKFIVAAGEPAKISNARDTILYAVIGLVVAGLAQALVAFILTILN